MVVVDDGLSWSLCGVAVPIVLELDSINGGISRIVVGSVLELRGRVGLGVGL